MMEQLYMPYHNAGPGTTSYRNLGPSSGSLQGGKMGTYMNRGGGQGPPGPPFDTIGSKLGNLTLDHSMKILNRQAGPSGNPAPTSPGFGPPRFPHLNSALPSGPSLFNGNQNFSRPGHPPSYPPSKGRYGEPPPHLRQQQAHMEPKNQAERKALEGLLRELEHRTGGGVGGSGGGSGGGGGRLSPAMRLNGPTPAHPTPPPLRPPNSLLNQQVSEQEAQAQAAAAANVAIFSDNGTTYFYNPEETLPSQLSTGQVVGNSVLLPNWSAYSGTLSQIVAMKVRSAAPAALQQSETKVELLTRQLMCHAAADLEANPDLPSEVDNYTSLCPLEPVASSPLHKSSTFGYVTTVYKAVNVKTGQHMCLRRIHGYRLVNTKCMGLVEQWKKMTHSNLVSLRQVFTSKSFGDHSMVFVYDYYPGSETLMVRHFSHSQMNQQLLDPFNGEASRPYSQTKNNLLRQQAAALSNTGLLAEALIWNYIIQLTSALRYIHASGLACRTLDPTKILVVGKSRLLLNCSGIFDVLTYDPNSSNPMATMAVYQQEDLVSLGRIVLALACNSFLAIQRENLQQSMELVTSNYSTDLRNLIMYLLTNPQRVKSVNDLMPMIGARFYTALDSCMQRTDMLEMELAKDLESARIVRLLTKLNTVVDRSEFNMDTTWAETGDRYMLKLFRDFLFHQVLEDGRPFLDMAHVITNLNRLDAGIPDTIGLMSRDEQNVLVVSYAELKNCLEQSFSEVLNAANTKPKINS